MAFNTIVSWDMLTCTDFADFGKCQDRFAQFFWSENNSDIKGFRLVQNLYKGEAEFNGFIRLKNQLVIAAEKFGREENFSPVLIPTMSKDMDEHLKLAHKEN